MVCNLVSIHFYSPQFQYSVSIALNLIEKKLYITLGYWCRDMLNIEFLEKSLVIVSPPHITYDFSRKILLILYFTSRQNLIVWLSLFLEVFGNMCIAIGCFWGCGVINFKVNLIVLIKPFFYITKKSRKKLRYLENGKSF